MELAYAQTLPASPLEWTELMHDRLDQLEGEVGATEVEDAGAGVEEVADVMGPKVEVNALPGPAIIALGQDAETELWYPTCNRCTLDRFSVDVRPQKRGRKE